MDPYKELKKQSASHNQIVMKGEKSIGVFSVFIDGIEVKHLKSAKVGVDEHGERIVTLEISVPLRNLHFE